MTDSKQPDSLAPMRAAADILNARPGVVANLEYPGWLNVFHAGKEWAFGDANGPWEGYQTKDSEPVEGTFAESGLPLECSDAEKIAAFILKAIGA